MLEIPGGNATVSGIFGALIGFGAHLFDSRIRARKDTKDLEAEFRDDLWAQNQALEKRIADMQQSHDAKVAGITEKCERLQQAYFDTYGQMVEFRALTKRYENHYGPLDKSDSPRTPK